MKARERNLNRITLVILAAVVLAVGAAALFMNALQKPAGATREVHIYQNGLLYATGHIGQKDDIVITGENGEENVVSFTDHGVFMKSASCHNQLCIEQGMVTAENFGSRFYRNQIICLPNRVTVELVLTEEEAADIPDV